MSTRKTTLVYAVLIAFAAGMVIASRLDLSPTSSAQTFVVPVTNSAPLTGTLDAQTFRNVAKAQQPMVVNIKTQVRRQTPDMSDLFGGRGGSPDDLFRFFGQPGDPGGRQGPQGPPGRDRREPTMTAAGTGFLISKDGLILTNNHVVEDAVKISVSLFGEENDQDYEAKLIGRDQYSDSALIQLIEKPNHALPEAKFGDSSQMAAGDWVVAIGNPFNYGWTVSVGVISAMERPFRITDGRQSEMIQTDAAINPGNSGGPLLNLRGEVIGVNTAIISSGRAEGNIGIGFAVPINTVRDLLPQLNTGKVVRGKIGVQIDVVPREGFEDFGLTTRTGVIVTSAVPGGAAEKAGVEAGDVILRFDNKVVSSSEDLPRIVGGTKPGSRVPMQVWRNKAARDVQVTVAELQEDRDAQQKRGAKPPAATPGVFGMSVSDLTEAQRKELKVDNGVLVNEVQGAAARAGIRKGDVILAVNNQDVKSVDHLRELMGAVEKGRIVALLIRRSGNSLYIPFRIEGGNAGGGQGGQGNQGGQGSQGNQ